jgi:peptidoglycan/xylan/chitin deacetylase (PgdA/CDA1 family)
MSNGQESAKKTTRRPSIWRRILTISPFALACSVIAVGYIGYRVFSMAGPNGLGAVLGKDTAQSAQQIGCSQDIDLELPTGDERLPLVSANYQNFIQRQPAKSDNLIANYSLEDIDPGTSLPRGYFRISDHDYLNYEFLREQTTNTPFLRAEALRKVSAAEEAGGWITNPIPIAKNATYSYSFTYRSTAAVVVSLELTMDDGRVLSQPVTDLHRSDTWQRFSFYFDNQRGAKAFRFVATTRDAGQIDMRDYAAYRIADARLPEPKISITFDDGWQSIAERGMPLLDKYGFKTTQYIISEASDQSVAQYMTVDMLKKLKSQGHEIGSHTLTHCDQTKLSNMDILKNARDSKNALERDGLGPITSYAYPYGRYNETTQPLVAGAYSYMRTSDVGYNDRYFDHRGIRSMVVLDTTTDKEFQSWIDYAKSHNLWLVLAYHRVDEQGAYSVTSAQLDRQLRMIKDSGIQVAPLTETAKQIR